jgi:transposase
MATFGRLSKIAELSRSAEVTTAGRITIGIDLGDRYSHCCFLGPNGECLTEGRIRTTPEALARHFHGLPPARIAIEVGGHSRWVSQQLTACGHEVLVANARMVQLIAAGVRKSDQVDAQLLARLARTDPTLLAPITHVGHHHYPDIARLRARALLVRTRTRLINAVRGIVKTVGIRLPVCNTRGFAAKAAAVIPADLEPSLGPLLETIASLSAQIAAYDRAVEQIAHAQYPETARLRQVPGVGPVTALHFVLTLGDPHRFRRSRDVGAFLGLVPKRHQSGGSEHQLRISKAGNGEMRTLLVQCAQYILGRFGPDTDLKRWGTAMAARGGKNAKRRAIIAVARKLSVLLHKLWISGAAYDPLFNVATALKSA